MGIQGNLRRACLLSMGERMGTVRKLQAVQKEARTSGLPEDFCWFWEEYPAKKAKLAALAAWKQTADVRPPIEEIIAAIAAQKNGRKWIEGFIPNPATWLRGGRWDDE